MEIRNERFSGNEAQMRPDCLNLRIFKDDLSESALEETISYCASSDEASYTLIVRYLFTKLSSMKESDLIVKYLTTIDKCLESSQHSLNDNVPMSVFGDLVDIVEHNNELGDICLKLGSILCEKLDCSDEIDLEIIERFLVIAAASDAQMLLFSPFLVRKKPLSEDLKDAVVERLLQIDTKSDNPLLYVPMMCFCHMKRIYPELDGMLLQPYVDAIANSRESFGKPLLLTVLRLFPEIPRLHEVTIINLLNEIDQGIVSSTLSYIISYIDTFTMPFHKYLAEHLFSILVQTIQNQTDTPSDIMDWITFILRQIAHIYPTILDKKANSAYDRILSDLSGESLVNIITTTNDSRYVAACFLLTDLSSMLDASLITFVSDELMKRIYDISVNKQIALVEIIFKIVPIEQLNSPDLFRITVELINSSDNPVTFFFIVAQMLVSTPNPSLKEEYVAILKDHLDVFDSLANNPNSQVSDTAMAMMELISDQEWVTLH